ncbi:peptidylprolyl isomerase [uncultured Roseibium sp.]|uniref:peptidylprolyl isomerase n=1 Tax=uncultured Roseibium sp. TaxID=1936171 RepID=UPI003216EDB3
MSIRTILKSPLLHFFALAGLIFALYAVLDDTVPAPPPDAITLNPEEAGRLITRFTKTWSRPPSKEEVNGLIRSWALEEAYVRDALALGLDRDDPVIRQRLMLKMQFLAESGAAGEQPGDATLQAYLDENPEPFRQPARLAFSQVLLPPDRAEETTEIRAQLENGADPATLGKASLLPVAVPMMPVPAIDRTFGAGFGESLAELPEGQWGGPVKSSYGLHLVQVSGRTEASLPPLSEIRDRVEAEWRSGRARDMRAAFEDALLARYTVTLPTAEEVLAQ